MRSPFFKPIIIGVITLILLTCSRMSLAGDITVCQPVFDALDSCDATLEARNEELKKYGVSLEGYDTEVKRLQKENRELSGKSESIFRNPFLYLFLGLATGMAVSK